MMFEIYTEEVEVSGEKYLIRPLSGRFLPKLFSLMENFDGEEDNKKAMANLDEDTIAKFHLLALETFKKSYPKEDKDILDEFVTQNLFVLIEVIMKVNLQKQTEQVEKKEVSTTKEE